MSRRERKSPAPRPLAEYLEGNAFVGGVVQLLVAVMIGALATSRATGHVLTPWTLAAVVAASAAGGVLVGWPIGLYGGAADMLKGLVVVPTEAAANADVAGDDLEPKRLWRTAAGWAVAAGAWSLAAAVLVVAVLDGRQAGALLVIASLAALGGVSGRAVDLAARRRGIELARQAAMAIEPVPERRRAWLHIALPVAAGQGLINAGVAWLLFHDYVQGAAFGPRALTEQAVVAEVATIVVLMVAIFAPTVRSWGEVDAALRRVELEEDVVAPVGPQAFVYLVIAAFVLGPMSGLLLPTAPTLLRVIVVRSVLAFAAVFVIAGLAHVRGAMNATAARFTAREVVPA